MQGYFPMTPLPREKIVGLLLMATWSTGPTKGYEFMDSWLLSGYAAQQAMLHIDFNNTTKGLRQGRMGEADKDTLRMWSAICLCHLQYSVGTGRPAIIAPIYIDQSRALLENLDAVLLDGVDVSSVMLFSSLQGLYTATTSTNFDDIWPVLQQWRKQWAHLFESRDYHRFMLEISYNFCLLVLAKRADAHKTGHPSTSQMMSPQDRETVLSGAWMTSSRTYAQRIIDNSRLISAKAFEEIPDFYHLCVVYAIIVLAQFTRGVSGDQLLRSELVELLQNWSKHNLSYLFGASLSKLENLLGLNNHEHVETEWDFVSPELQDFLSSVFSA